MAKAKKPQPQPQPELVMLHKGNTSTEFKKSDLKSLLKDGWSLDETPSNEMSETNETKES